MKKLPAQGLVGETALREAAAGEMRDLIELVRSALAEKLGKQLGRTEPWWIDLEAIYPDRAVVRIQGRFYAHPFTVAEDNVVTFGEPAEVVREFTVVSEMREAVVMLEAAEGEKSSSFTIKIIEAGTSKNKKIYPEAVLREAVPLFNGCRVFVKSDEEHLEGKGKSVRNLIGGLRDCQFLEAVTGAPAQLRARLDVLDEGIAIKLREALDKKLTHLFGFSIDVEGEAKRKGQFVEAVRFTKIHSVDMIVDAGAGGELINFIEAVASTTPSEDDAMKARMIEAIKKAHNGKLPAGLDENDENAVFVAFQEATAAASKTDTSGLVTKEQLALMETRTSMREAVRASKLPEAAQDKLITQLESDQALTTAKFTEAIKDEREYLAKFTESGTIRGLGGGDGAVGAKGIAEMLDKLIAGTDSNVISLKECYQEATGDKRVTGQIRDCRFREATMETTSFPILLGDAINRRLLDYYRDAEFSEYDIWRHIVSDIVPLSDFRTRNNILIGGYGDLPEVAQNDPYVELDEPSELKEAYVPKKRGGLSSVTLETIKNDDVGFVMKIPRSLALAARRTLCKFVLDMIRVPPTMSDTKALFHVDHANLGTAAFSKVNYAAARLLMKAQADHDTGERLGLLPHILLHPGDLDEAVYDAFRRDTNIDPDFVQTAAPKKLLSVWYWTDATDWAMICNPALHPTIEIGFLDNKQEPEIFIQDSPSQGSLFANDAVTYKIRHIYGGGPSSWKGMRKHVVA